MITNDNQLRSTVLPRLAYLLSFYVKSVWRSCFTASTKLFDNKNEDTDQTVEEASVIGNQMEQMYGVLETREDADATIAIADDEAVNEFETCAIVHKLDRLAPIGYSYGFNLQLTQL